MAANALPTIIDSSRLPLAELSALRLDGELAGLGHGYLPVDLAEAPATRTLSISVGVPAPFIAALHTAAWIWGCRDHAPAVQEWCLDAADGRRPRVADPLIHRVRELLYLPGETTRLAGRAVTTPRRTIVDLLRFPESWTDLEARTAERLARGWGVPHGEVERSIREQRAPHTRRALDRLASMRLAR